MSFLTLPTQFVCSLNTYLVVKMIGFGGVSYSLLSDRLRIPVVLIFPRPLYRLSVQGTSDISHI